MKKRRWDLSKELRSRTMPFGLLPLNPKIESTLALEHLQEKTQMPWFVKIEEGIVDKPTFDRHVLAHKAYVQDLIAKGYRAKTGYWAERGGGMLLFEANSLEAAKVIVEQDPLVKNNCVKYKLHEWCILVE